MQNKRWTLKHKTLLSFLQKEAAPSQRKHDYAPEPKSKEYSYSSSKKQPTKLYSYETTDKPVAYSYKTESKSKPKTVYEPEHEFYSPSEYQFSKTVDDPLKTYYESSSYGNEDDKPAEENAPHPHTVEPPKYRRQSQEQQPQQVQEQIIKQNAPQVS